MDEVSNYKLACQSAQAMVQDYLAGDPPFVHADAAIPLVPCHADGASLVDDPAFEYVELTLPGGKNYLAVLTPFEVLRGPGPKYHVTRVG